MKLFKRISCWLLGHKENMRIEDMSINIYTCLRCGRKKYEVYYPPVDKWLVTGKIEYN